MAGVEPQASQALRGCEDHLTMVPPPPKKKTFFPPIERRHLLLTLSPCQRILQDDFCQSGFEIQSLKFAFLVVAVTQPSLSSILHPSFHPFQTFNFFYVAIPK